MASRFTTPHKIVVLGDGGVGKTALTIQLCLQHFIETVSPSYPSLLLVSSRQAFLRVSPPTPRHAIVWSNPPVAAVAGLEHHHASTAWAGTGKKARDFDFDFGP